MTTGAVNATFVGTNILVYEATSQAPLHSAATSALEGIYNAGDDL